MSEVIQDQPAPGDTPLQFTVSMDFNSNKISLGFNIPVTGIHLAPHQAAGLAAALADGVSKLLKGEPSAIVVPGGNG